MTIRKTLTQLRLGTHDTMSAFAPYRMAHGGYWVRHAQCGWYTVQKYRFEAYHGAGSHSSIEALEYNSDPWQVWGTRLCTAVLGLFTLTAIYLLATP